jgi:phospholipid/cholesterol/gamma-HCH transport system ATP-binding protein
LFKSFGKKPVLRGVNCQLSEEDDRAHRFVGSGKSVIIKHIMGLFKPDSGEIRVRRDIVPLNELEMNEVRQNSASCSGTPRLDWFPCSRTCVPLRERTKPARRDQ